MAAKKKKAPARPKGIRARTLRDGSVKYDALVTLERGKQRSLGSFDTFDDAVAARHAYFKAEAARGEPRRVDPGLLTVRQLGNLCLEGGKEWDDDRWRARVLETAEFADWPAAQVRREHVQVWLDQMAHTPIAGGRSAGQLPSHGTLHSALSLLRRVYRWGAMPSRRYVTHNPAEGVTIGNSTDAKPRSKRYVLDYLREDECRRVIDADRTVLPLEPRTKFLVLMFSGARPADVWRLTWDRIDWATESIRFTSTKTSKQQARDYTVHALPPLMAALREWHLHCGRRTEGLVFRNADGDVFARGYDAGWADKRYRQHYWRKGVKSKADDVTTMEGYRRKVGIARDVPLYALRHTCACNLLLGTRLFTGGRMWSREEVQAQLGHLTPQATEHYMLALGILGRRAALESKAAMRAAKKVDG